jgi:hypothetical protein
MNGFRGGLANSGLQIGFGTLLSAGMLMKLKKKTFHALIKPDVRGENYVRRSSMTCTVQILSGRSDLGRVWWGM